MKIGFLSVVVLILVLIGKLYAEDEIYLKNGNKLVGQIAEDHDDYILLAFAGGRIKIMRSEIRKMNHIIEEVAPEGLLKREQIAQSIEEKKHWWEYLTKEIQNIMNRQKDRKGKGFRGDGVANMSTKDWLEILSYQMFGSEFTKKINKELLSKIAFSGLIGFILFGFVIRIIVKFLGGNCAFSDAFLFQIKTFLFGGFFVLFIKGALPVMLLIFFPSLSQYEAGMRTGFTVFAILGFGYIFIQRSRKDMELNTYQGLGLLGLVLVLVLILKFVLGTYLIK